MKKDIILISPKFSESIGGMETHSLEFVKYFSNTKKFNLKSVLVNKKIKDGILLDKPPRDSSYIIPIKRTLSGNFDIDLKIILSEIKSEDTIIFFNSPTWLSIIRKIKDIYPRVKTILRSGGNDIIAGWIGNENDLENDLILNRNKIVSLINNHIDSLIVNSDYSKKRFIDIGINENLMKILKGGVDIDKFKSNSNKNTKLKILSTGRLVKFKGFEYSLKAIKILKEDIGNCFEYYLIGSGPEENKIKNLILKLEIWDVVKLKKAVAFENIQKYYNSSDIFLHLPIELIKKERNSSYIHTETMGRSACEALSSSLPCIVSNVGGIKEIVIENKLGYLVSEKDSIHAYKCLKKLIINEKLRLEISNNARNYSTQNYSWDYIFSEYEKIFLMLKAEVLI